MRTYYSDPLKLEAGQIIKILVQELLFFTWVIITETHVALPGLSMESLILLLSFNDSYQIEK